MVTGEVAILKAGGRQRLLPDLSIAVAGDEASDLLYAAIPLSRHERARLPEEVRWPGGILSSGARLLRDVSLEGELQSFGSITTGAEGRVEYDIAFGLDDARAAPTESLSRAIGAAGLLWPEGFSIEHVKSLLRVRRDAVELIEFAGRHDNGDVVATGRVDLAGEVADTTLDVSFGDLALGEYLVNLLPSERLERGRELWNRYEPTGSFDAALHYHAAGETVDPPVLVVQPHELTVRLDERGATIAYAGGDLCLSAGQVEFRDLEVNLQCDDEDNGTLRIDGSYGVADESGAAGDQLHLTGEWQGGRFESPLVLEALHLFDAQRQAQRYLEYGFAGVFNAEFDYSSAGEDRPRNFELSIHPRTVSVSLNDTDLSVELDRSSNIRFVPGLIELSNVTGRLAEDPFTLNGTIRPGERPDLDFLFDYKGYLHGAHVQALLPGPVRAVLEAIEFDEGLPTRLADCRLRLVGVETGVASSQAESGSPWGNWLIDFRGTMLTERASLKAGVKVKEMDGAIDIELHHRPSLTPQLSMEVQIDRMDVLGITFTDARASIFLNEDGTRILMPDLQAKTHDGKATAEAIAGVGEQKDYRAEIDLVGVELGGLLAGLNGSPAESNRAPDAEGGTRGELWASLTVAGRRDEPQSRVGRGELRLLGGQVAAIPLALRLVQVLQLSAPLGQGLDYAESEFFITGDKLVFNRILFESTVMDSIAALQLRGEGELDLNSQQLNTRFRSRGGLLLVRDVLGGIGDQLYVIEVSGPLSDPKASIVPLPGLSR